MDNLKKKGNYYIGPKHDWEKELYGFYPMGKGDLIYNTLRTIIETNDTSKWAHNAFEHCSILLTNGRRWPESMDNERDAKHRVDKWLMDFFKFIKVNKHTKYRSSDSVTRDPWIMLYATAIFLGQGEFINLKPHWLLYNPKVWAWRKALLGQKSSYKFWAKLSDVWHMIVPRKDYVEILEHYIKWSYDNKPTGTEVLS